MASVLEQCARADGRGTSRLSIAARARARVAPRRHLAFLALWSLLSGAVVVLKLFNPIFLPGPWLVLGNVLDMAVRGQLWIHLAATLERVALGFGVGAALGVATWPGGRASVADSPRRRADHRVAPADPTVGDAADVHRLGRDRRGLQGRVHHVRDVLPDLPDDHHRRASDRSGPPAGGPEPRRARRRALHARDPAGRAAGYLDRTPARRGAGVLRHRHLGVHRRRAWPRLSDQ